MDTKKAQKLIDALAETKTALKASSEYTAFKEARTAFKEAQTAYQATSQYVALSKIKTALKELGGIRRVQEYLKLQGAAERLQELEGEMASSE